MVIRSGCKKHWNTVRKGVMIITVATYYFYNGGVIKKSTSDIILHQLWLLKTDDSGHKSNLEQFLYLYWNSYGTDHFLFQLWL